MPLLARRTSRTCRSRHSSVSCRRSPSSRSRCSSQQRRRPRRTTHERRGAQPCAGGKYSAGCSIGGAPPCRLFAAAAGTLTVIRASRMRAACINSSGGAGRQCRWQMVAALQKAVGAAGSRLHLHRSSHQFLVCLRTAVLAAWRGGTACAAPRVLLVAAAAGGRSAARRWLLPAAAPAAGGVVGARRVSSGLGFGS